MNIIEFPEQTTVIAEHQPQYIPMPAHQDNDGVVTCCWQLSEAELLQVAKTGVIWHQISTSWDSLQPQLLSVEKPTLGP